MTAIDPRLRRWRWRVFAATWLSYAGFYFCRKPFYIAKGSLGDELGWDATVLGAIGAAYLIAYTIGQFVAGWAGQRLGPRILLLTGMAVSAAANGLFGIADSPSAFGAFMVINGLAQATGWAGNVGSMAHWFHRRERGTVMGLWATNYQVGGVLAGALAAYSLGALGYRWSFFGGSLVLLGVWLFFLVNQRNRPEDVGLPPVAEPEESVESARTEPGSAAVRDGALQADGSGGMRAGVAQTARWSRRVAVNVLLVGMFYFFVKFIRYSLWSWAPYLLHTSYGLGAEDAGYVSISFDLAGVAGVVAAGFLSDRLFAGRRARISFLFIAAMAASTLLLYVKGSTSVVSFAVCMGLIGFTLYGPDALMSGAGAIDVGSRRGATLAAGIINGMGSIGSVVQELVLGAVIGKGELRLIFAVLFASGVLAVACLAVLLWRNHIGAADL